MPAPAGPLKRLHRSNYSKRSSGQSTSPPHPFVAGPYPPLPSARIHPFPRKPPGMSWTRSFRTLRTCSKAAPLGTILYQKLEMLVAIFIQTSVKSLIPPRIFSTDSAFLALQYHAVARHEHSHKGSGANQRSSSIGHAAHSLYQATICQHDPQGTVDPDSCPTGTKRNPIAH
jgi:hypothetical protein